MDMPFLRQQRWGRLASHAHGGGECDVEASSFLQSFETLYGPAAFKMGDNFFVVLCNGIRRI
jgi:hypothetical protein